MLEFISIIWSPFPVFLRPNLISFQYWVYEFVLSFIYLINLLLASLHSKPLTHLLIYLPLITIPRDTQHTQLLFSHFTYGKTESQGS